MKVTCEKCFYPGTRTIFISRVNDKNSVVLYLNFDDNTYITVINL